MRSITPTGSGSTAVAVGVSTINGTIQIDDGEKHFSFDVSVSENDVSGSVDI